MGSSSLSSNMASVRKIPCLLVLATLVLSFAFSKEDRQDRFLSVFNVVKFPNDACDAGNKNGTCYTKDECDNLGGTNDGSCASGYGVCCTFALNCGEKSSQNNTYFESDGSEVGSCNVKICPMNSDICQLRLDFETFVITGPSTLTTTTIKVLNGVASSGGAEMTTASRCLTDTFSVITSQEGPPTICGRNSNMHMYVQMAQEECSELNFNLGQTATGASLATRSWSIRVTQYDCGFENAAPTGCSQYFWGEDNGYVQTYNFDGSYHLADQKMKACFRREKGNCKICYTADSYPDFAISKSPASATPMKGKFITADCCSYGADGMGSDYDCLRIPSVELTKGTLLKAHSGFCGNGGIYVKSTDGAWSQEQKSTTYGNLAMTSYTICSKRQPFHIAFNSDSFEGAMEVSPGNGGFRLAYLQSSNNC